MGPLRSALDSLIKVLLVISMADKAMGIFCLPLFGNSAEAAFAVLALPVMRAAPEVSPKINEGSPAF